MEKRKGILVSYSDFRQLATKGYYIDKTLLIRDLFKGENSNEMVTVITRPRRFGKSVNLSMLRCFFDMEEDSKELFSDLKIGKCADITAKHQNKYPVIVLDLKGLEADSTEDFYDALQTKILLLYSSFQKEIEDSLKPTDIDYKLFEKIADINVDASKKTSFLLVLSKILYKIRGVKPVILIDEYDAPLTYAYAKGDDEHFQSVLGAIRDILSAALKGQDICLSFAVITGCAYITKNNLFSGLNNPLICTIKDDDFADCYGFTEEEVKSSLDYFGLSEHFDDVARWYDGYSFGDITIYNPWSISHFLRKGETGAYWISTGSNHLINKAIADSVFDENNDYFRLVNRRSVRADIRNDITFENLLTDKSNLYTLLFHSGYLKIVGKSGDKTVLTLVNYEVEQSFENIFKSSLRIRRMDLENTEKLIAGLLKLDVKMTTEALDIILNNIQTTYKEKVYQGILIGIFCNLDKNHYIARAE
jgi:hypothetical protein